MDMDNKTPRHRTACDTCKRMKIKCEWDQEGICNRCQGREINCTVTAKVRKKREKKKNSHVSLLEAKLKRMEHVMTNSGLSVDASRSDRQPSEEINDQAAMLEKFSALNISDTGVEEFWGAASGFFIFSPHGLQRVSKLTGNDQFANYIGVANHKRMSQYSVPASLWYAMPDHKHKPLPPREIADQILEFVFDTLIPSLPLFDRKTFMERYSRQYPVKCSENPAWYACLNVCFALASVIRKEKLPASSPESPKSSSSGELESLPYWGWLRNAASTFVHLQFGPPSLMAVQAMAGLAFMLNALSDVYPCSVVSAATVRLAQAIGLHRKISDSVLNEAEIEQRRNVFWIAIMIERGVVIRHGRPSVIHDEDIGVDLPPENQYSEEFNGRFVTFRHNAVLSLLQGRIYNRLYSAKSFTKSKTERLKIVGMLDDELQQWCETIPVEVRPGYPLKCDKNHFVTAVCMQWGYYQCLITIHKVSLYYGPGPLDMDEEEPQSDLDPKLNPRVYASAAICVNAARKTIDLLNNCFRLSSPVEVNILRIFIHYALAAHVSLFENVLEHPLDPQAQYDIQLMNDVISFLSSFEDSGAAESHPAVPIFQEMNHVAAEHVKKAQREATQYTKRSRSSSHDSEELYTESDESEEEDYYKVEEEVNSNIIADAHDPQVSLSPANSARSQVSPVPPIQSQSDIPPEMRPFDHNSLNYKSEHIPMSMQQSYNVQPTAHDPYQIPPFYEHDANLPDLNYQHPQDQPENYQNQPQYTSQLKLESQSYPSHPDVPTPHPATGFYFSSSEQHQQNITPYHSETYTSTLSNPNAVPQDQTSTGEELLVPQYEDWFFPMMSPWFYEEQSDSNLIVGAADENGAEAWRHEGNNGEGGGLDGWAPMGDNV
ncbi:c61468a0-9166-417d-a668-0208a30c0a27 [Sclerotinia trifoliorum]|uniref:C61468a0-9166-417d-a668-0208a30c0a27 n=1 Tax=Sclerotinia trifoliorum TaxID=28548 RepID=A0A8H2W1T2_9HELO|nr:c61468a0-9166-417d-a668-0208a30c0a27 [Sclerotinia trifoliorum]